MLQKGDSVFFCYGHITDKAKNDYDYYGRVWRTLEALGLTPFVHAGATLDVRKSNLDRQVRDNFYNSKVVVTLLLGKDHRAGGTIRDNWAIPELKSSALKSGITCLVYATPEVTNDEINSLNIPMKVAIVKGPDDFEVSLKQDLGQLMK